MKKNNDAHHRRSIRLKDYDYTQPGGYFITIVTFQRDLLFGQILNGEIQLNDHGRVVEECWRSIPEHFLYVELGAYIVMPNHVHGIIIIMDHVGATHASPLPKLYPPRGPEPKSIGAIVGSFKSAVTRRLGREFNITNIWQRNYYERVIRDHKDWERIYQYIESNPEMWENDDENPL
jgi:REP element-mobilizing transposase RayT